MSNNGRAVQRLCIWAYTYCRSVLAFYDELAKYYSVPLKIFLAKPRGLSRIGIGWSEDEFQHLDICVIGNDIKIIGFFLNLGLSYNRLIPSI